MAGEFAARRAVARSERTVCVRCVPIGHANGGSAAGEILPVRAQVHSAVGKFSQHTAADFHQLYDARMCCRRRRYGRPAAADVAIVRTEVRGAILKQSDHGVARSDRYYLENLTVARKNANARATSAQVEAVR